MVGVQVLPVPQGALLPTVQEVTGGWVGVGEGDVAPGLTRASVRRKVVSSSSIVSAFWMLELSIIAEMRGEREATTVYLFSITSTDVARGQGELCISRTPNIERICNEKPTYCDEREKQGCCYESHPMTAS